MKKFFKSFMMILVILTLTGCMSTNITMEIGKDKSMNLEIIAAVSDELMSQMEETEESKAEYEKMGFYVEDYKENGMTGFKLTKKIKNIDSVSTDAKISEDEMTEALVSKDGKIFMVKKGLFKNTYKGSIKFENSQLLNQDYSNMDESSYIEEYREDCEYEFDDGAYSVVCTGKPILDQAGNRAKYDEYVEKTREQANKLKEASKNMENKFVLKLPYKAISNNATNVENGEKLLTWDFSKVGTASFEFAVYNMTRVYIAVGIGIVLLLGIIFGIIKKCTSKPKPKNKPITNYPETKGFLEQMEKYENQKVEPTPVTDEPVQNVDAPVIEETPANIELPPVELKEEVSESKFITDDLKEEKIEVKETPDETKITDVYNNLKMIPTPEPTQKPDLLKSEHTDNDSNVPPLI